MWGFVSPEDAQISLADWRPVYQTNTLTNTVFLPVTGSYLPPAYFRTNTPPPIPVPVTIISPLVDSDVLDLSSSSRSQDEFALALSFALRYAGLKGQADAFEQFVKNRQSDAHTRIPEVAVNSFSGNDGKFGFQIGPRVEALDPAKKTDDIAQPLMRQSFPALLILRLGSVDLTPSILTEDNTVEVLEPALKFTEMTQWLPLKHNFARDAGFYAWFRPTYWKNPSFTEVRRLELLEELNDANNVLSNGVGISLDATNLISKRIADLQSQLAGGDGLAYLPADNIIPAPVKAGLAVIESVEPTNIVIAPDANTGPFPVSVYVFGNNLTEVNLKGVAELLSYLPGGVSRTTNTYQVKKINDQVLLITNPDAFTFSSSASNGFDLVFSLSTTNEQKALLTPPVHVSIFRNVRPMTGTIDFAVSTTFGAHPSNESTDKTTALPTNAIATSAGDRSAAPATSVSSSAIKKTPGEQSVTTNSESIVKYSVSISTNATEVQISAARDLIKAELEKDKANSLQSSNTVMSVIVNRKTPASAQAQ